MISVFRASLDIINCMLQVPVVFMFSRYIFLGIEDHDIFSIDANRWAVTYVSKAFFAAVHSIIDIRLLNEIWVISDGSF